MAASAPPAACAGDMSASLHGVSVPSDRSRLATSPAVLYTLAFGVGLVLDHIHPQRILSDALAFVVGAGVLVAGGVLATWTNRTAERARSVSNVLATSGPFAFSRHPMHLARTLLYLGTALERNALWALATLIPLLLVMHFEVVRAEERSLVHRFGDAYRRYCARVRRWV